ncbi:hypothetical protein [Halorubrum cibi]|uniref:Uncharacterized protein n=1 Tax=Halorubrum cibi TaxID=413815 RepID=A0A521AJB9_9EURY|nr:hypothetical protein [Halorubrum cibi]SMO34883.1 hypothetical protein SAMN06264867_101192 [Halorubrum cibi]
MNGRRADERHTNRRRVLAAIGAAAGVGLAGCLGGSVDGPFSDADWREDDGLDVATLAESHVELAVEAGGVTLFSTAETTFDGEGDPSPWLPSQEYESRYDLENGRWYFRRELTGGEEPEVLERYVADGEALVRERAGEDVRYGRQAVDRTADDFERALREEALVGIRVPQGNGDSGETTYAGLGNWSPKSDGEGEVDGRATARFVADSFDGDRDVPATVETASATVHVFESGFVPRIEQSWEGPHDGGTATVEVDIAYRDRGATVAAPEWAEEAREETAG